MKMQSHLPPGSETRPLDASYVGIQPSSGCRHLSWLCRISESVREYAFMGAKVSCVVSVVKYVFLILAIFHWLNLLFRLELAPRCHQI